MKRTTWLFVLASMMAVGCGASEPSSESNTPAQQSNEYATLEVGERSDLRNVRYCEVIVVTGRLNDIEGAVYNTIGLNDCPAEQWEELDPEQLKEEFRANEIV